MHLLLLLACGQAADTLGPAGAGPVDTEIVDTGDLWTDTDTDTDTGAPIDTGTMDTDAGPLAPLAVLDWPRNASGHLLQGVAAGCEDLTVLDSLLVPVVPPLTGQQVLTVDLDPAGQAVVGELSAVCDGWEWSSGDPCVEEVLDYGFGHVETDPDAGLVVFHLQLGTTALTVEALDCTSVGR